VKGLRQEDVEAATWNNTGVIFRLV
jgi:hypothetical protein